MWWSFYEGESSFSNFLDEALIYFSSRKVTPTSSPSTYEKVRQLVNLLQQQRALLVLDGFERQLRAYASLDAAYQTDQVTEESRDARACIDPITAQLLRDLIAGGTGTKLLITTRLRVRDLEDQNGDPLAGCRIEELKGLHKDDAVAFMRAQGITKGAQDKIIAVCMKYGNHPLSLRLLSGFIKKDKRKPGDITVAPNYYKKVHEDLKARQHHILEVSYNALSEHERILLSRMAAFRTPMPFEALTLFNTFSSDSYVDVALDELVERGLIFHDTQHNRYDLHPVVRQYAYERLSDKFGTHAVLRDYFAAIPEPQKKVETLEDLDSVIELYHHTINAGRYDDAIELYVDRLNIPLFNLGAYQIIIEFLSPLLIRGEDRDRDHAKRRLLHPLAKAYEMSGDTRMAVTYYESEVKIRKTLGERRQAAIALRNLADAKIALGDLSSVERDLHDGIDLCREAGEEGLGRGLHRKLGILLTYEGRNSEAKVEMSYIPSKFRTARQSDIAPLGELALYALLRRDFKSVLKDATYMRKLAGKFQRESDIIFAEWLLGVVHFNMDDLLKSRQHLNEAVVRCRRVKFVELEPDILLAWARWHQANHNSVEARIHAEEALAIANRRDYRLKQAEIHNFFAWLALESRDDEGVRRHAQTAFERAWCNGPPHCYKLALEEAKQLSSQA